MTEADRNDIAVLVRQKIRNAMAEYADTWDATTGSMITSFLVIAEVATTDGDRALIEVNSSPMDEVGIARWTRDGFLFSALHDEWYRKNERGDGE